MSKETKLSSQDATQVKCAKCDHGKGRIHELKTWTQYFSAILSGHKTFELRKNDRGFECGDVLWLREWDQGGCEYTGRETFRRICFIISGPGFGLETGFVVMSLSPSDLMIEAALEVKTGVQVPLNGGVPR